MKMRKQSLYWMAIMLSIFSVIAAYLAFAQAQLLDRYIKRVEIQPDFSKYEQSNMIILVLSGLALIGIYLLTIGVYRWLQSKQLVTINFAIAYMPWVNLLVIHRLGRQSWERLEYEAMERDEFHRKRKWIQLRIWFWGIFIAFPLVFAGGIWLLEQLGAPDGVANTTSTVYALVMLTVAHAITTLTGIFTLSVVSSLDNRL